MQISTTETHEFTSAAPSEPPVCPAKEGPRPLPAGLPNHPLADLFPMLAGREFQDMVDDIKAKGLLSPITTLDGAILEGRNRYRACIEAGIVPVGEEYAGSDPIAFVVSSNLMRRHLTESQRAMIAAKLADMPQGARTDRQPSATLRKVSQSNAASIMNVSTRSAARASKVRKQGVQELRERVERGETAVSVAAKLAALPPDEQRKVLDSGEAMRSAVAAAASTKREAGLAHAIRRASEQVGRQLYGVIYADPPWPPQREHEDRNGDPTDGIEALRSMLIPAAEHAVVFLWATLDRVPDAFSILKSWGFTYCSQIVLVKGSGRWGHDHHEQLLIATRGDFPGPADGKKIDSVQVSAPGPGGAKPEILIASIKELFPNLPCLELFAHKERAGWDTLIITRADELRSLSEAPP